MKRVLGLMASFLILFSSAMTASGASMTDSAQTDALELLQALSKSADQAIFCEDGRIIFPLIEIGDKRKISAIECINNDKKLIWKCEVPPSDATIWIQLKQIEEGSFAFIGRADDALYHMTLVGNEGNTLQTVLLPADAQTPKIVSDGVYYVTTSASDKNTVSLWKMKWSGQITEQKISDCTNLSILEVLSGSDKVYLKTQYKSENGENKLAVICLDVNCNIVWRYEVGDFLSWGVNAWTLNNYNGITLSASNLNQRGESRESLLCINSKGAAIWTHDLYLDLGLPTVVHVLKQASDGRYLLWGLAKATESRNITFSMQTDSNGGFSKSDLKAEWSLCKPYIDGEIFAIVYSDSMETNEIVPFSALQEFRK